MISQVQTLTAINVPDLSSANDDFTAMETHHVLDWIRLSGLPANGLEQHFKGIRISRYRAAMQAALRVSPESFVISHLPLMTAAVSHLLAVRGCHVPHLGFAFNFTELPRGVRYRYLRKAISRVDQLAVFSSFERVRYAEYFDLDPSQFVPVLWTHDPPPVQSDPGGELAHLYLCAVGSQGRDFRLLMEVARLLGPSVPLIVIASARYLGGLKIPSNVRWLADLPLAQVWRIAADSRGVLIPLLSRDTCCGHVTLVSAKLLGLPVATTRAYATREYVDGRAGVLQCEPGDAAAYANLARQLFDDHTVMKNAAQADMGREREIHDRQHWATYLDDFIEKRVLG